MKLYLWLNSSAESDFTGQANIIMPNGSNAHSGGVVVLAESIEEAAELAKKYLGSDPRDCCDEGNAEGEAANAAPVVIDLDKKGVVIHASGAC